MVQTISHSIIALGMLTLAVGTTAAKELLGDSIAGRKLAQDVCAACHVVEPGLEPRSDVDAPAFPEIAKQPGITAISLRVFLQTPHERMPDLQLSPEETDDIIAHILSLDR